MLVVHLHADRAVRGLRNLGNREAGLGRQRRAVDDQDAALKHLTRRLIGVVRVLELLVDELWSPAHDFADPTDMLPPLWVSLKNVRFVCVATRRRMSAAAPSLWSRNRLQTQSAR